ncbi:poly(U)-specific endoribonuclease-like [Antedon mediterranea]|uniref:poly(U)-specific endoribonuclease-like n=1 Tax=Antedon mediterranea TaxID=105859 RepID=UPI003AF95897
MASFKPDKEFSDIATKLWDADENRLTPGTDYAINLQGKTFYHNMGQRDSAKEPLFSYVNMEKLKKMPTYKCFIALLDNYESETGIAEVVTEAEVRENQVFIDAIMETKVMKIVHKYLADKKLSPKDVRGFKHQLYDMWFKLYRRTRGDRDFDSSGFEHVFVGENKRNTNEVTGFHNWIKFYLEEVKGNIDYKGWLPPKIKRGRPRADNNAQLVTIQFTWKGGVKPLGSSFIGTSPEFEMALYTLFFLTSEKDEQDVEIEDYDVQVKVHHLGKMLGSCYPVIRQ